MARNIGPFSMTHVCRILCYKYNYYAYMSLVLTKFSFEFEPSKANKGQIVVDIK